MGKKSNKYIREKPANGALQPKGKSFGNPLLQTDKILWITVSIIFLLVLYIRIRLLSTALERDEGEYAYMGQLLLKGILPFKEAYNMKFPGTNMMYAFFMTFFGQNPVGIHLGLLCINAGSAYLLFILYQKWTDSKSKALIASSIFAFLAVSQGVFGFAAHATHFIVFFALAGLVLLYRAFDHTKISGYLISGLIFGLSVLMKQPAIFFVLLGLCLILTQYFYKKFDVKKLIRYSIVFITGSLFPLILLVTILKIGGTFDRFWFWTVQYGMQYGSIVNIQLGIEAFKHSFSYIFSESWLFWILAASGLLILIISKGWRNGKLEIILFFAFSFLALIPGLYFREHYFVMLLPALSILVVEGLFYMANKIKLIEHRDLALTIILIVIISWTLISNSSYFLSDSPEVIVRKIYEHNPFIESYAISDFIEARTTPDDRIEVFGSEPEIYFYSNRLAASGHIYMYGLMEPQRYSSFMQQEMINDVARNKPKYIVFCNIRKSWLERPNSDKHLLIWSKDYITKYYNLAGVADLGEETTYKWMNDALFYQPKSNNVIFIFERRGK
jgi:hypothetical protein